MLLSEADGNMSAVKSIKNHRNNLSWLLIITYFHRSESNIWLFSDRKWKKLSKKKVWVNSSCLTNNIESTHFKKTLPIKVVRLKSTGIKGRARTHQHAHTQRLGGACADRHARKSPGTVLSLSSLKQTMAPWNKGLCAQSQRAPSATLPVYLCLCLTHSRARTLTISWGLHSQGWQLAREGTNFAPMNSHLSTCSRGLGKHERTLAVYFCRQLSLFSSLQGRDHSWLCGCSECVSRRG